jgi:hypothetical protein
MNIFSQSHLTELLTPMERSANVISEELETLFHNQQYLRNRELRNAISMGIFYF